MTHPAKTEKIINISQLSSSDSESDLPPSPPSESRHQVLQSEGPVSRPDGSVQGVRGSSSCRKKSFLIYPGPQQQRQRAKEVSGPTFLSDQEMEEGLKFCLRQLRCYENTSGFRLRGEVIREVEELVNLWVRGETEGEGAQGRLVCYGSYKLSVIDCESDLDLLCVVPSQVTRTSFFTTFYHALQNKVSSGV